jgi:hypothetical protein
MIEDDDVSDEPLNLVHEPMHPPRNGFIGENVFAAAWKEEMAKPGAAYYDCDEYALGAVLWNMPGKLTQRRATVAASFVTWLGTNAGAGLLYVARGLEKRMVHTAMAYQAAWAHENERRRGINNGIRLLEYQLAMPENIETNPMFFTGGLRSLPVLSADDYEVAEHVVRWLAEHGQPFVIACEAEIKRLQNIEREAQLRSHAEMTRDDRLKHILSIGAN